MSAKKDHAREEESVINMGPAQCCAHQKKKPKQGAAPAEPDGDNSCTSTTQRAPREAYNKAKSAKTKTAAGSQTDGNTDFRMFN